jgi:hypothetical protein
MYRRIHATYAFSVRRLPWRARSARRTRSRSRGFGGPVGGVSRTAKPRTSAMPVAGGFQTECATEGWPSTCSPFGRCHDTPSVQSRQHAVSHHRIARSVPRGRRARCRVLAGLAARLSARRPGWGVAERIRWGQEGIVASRPPVRAHPALRGGRRPSPWITPRRNDGATWSSCRPGAAAGPCTGCRPA